MDRSRAGPPPARAVHTGPPPARNTYTGPPPDRSRAAYTGPPPPRNYAFKRKEEPRHRIEKRYSISNKLKEIYIDPQDQVGRGQSGLFRIVIDRLIGPTRVLFIVRTSILLLVTIRIVWVITDLQWDTIIALGDQEALLGADLIQARQGYGDQGQRGWKEIESPIILLEEYLLKKVGKRPKL